ncbi:energy transducer TonB [Tenacibaculum sp. M341]|uniref:energy transducer TonB n=1 Tax=Tenacibaculum sp. M341 TaxID=2530339 RepID=UPI00105314AA|nr:energy transducer TonB [Tenacibaculum sp. M341]TCI91724.1 energy transducer TonB [Tenacibaculum sp. M341]
MQLLDTKHKRKSAIITAVILLLLLFLMYGFGMKYMDPPIEYGVAINYGDSSVGNGEPVEEVKTASSQESNDVQEEVEDQVEEEVEETPTEEAVQEEVITDDSATDAPVVEKNKEDKVEGKTEEVKEEKPKEEKPKEKPKPKPSKATTDALNSLLNGDASDTGKPQGEGDDKESGVKGSKDGDLGSSNYYGKKGGGSGGNYNLAGRKALAKPIQKPKCEEEGRVVVRIEVDNNGNVIKAIPGVKGSTNTAPCLLEPAKQAALKTKWNADGKAPAKQRGTIIYNFSLSK